MQVRRRVAIFISARDWSNIKGRHYLCRRIICMHNVNGIPTNFICGRKITLPRATQWPHSCTIVAARSKEHPVVHWEDRFISQTRNISFAMRRARCNFSSAVTCRTRLQTRQPGPEMKKYTLRTLNNARAPETNWRFHVAIIVRSRGGTSATHRSHGRADETCSSYERGLGACTNHGLAARLSDQAPAIAHFPRLHPRI